MVKKSTKTLFVCNDCGREYLQWQGRCDGCGEWNTLAKISVAAAQTWHDEDGTTSISLKDASLQPESRLNTGVSEFDRALGGGLVRGSVVLLSGDPGVGKSTLLLQVAAHVARSKQSVLYICGEESQSQVRSRAERLGIADADIILTTVTDAVKLAAVIASSKPDLVIADSVQTLVHPEYPSSAGSIVQLRECGLILSQTVKRSGSALVLVGHVTKQGTIAGPRVLEHMVDAVMSFDSQSDRAYRLIRVEKNRFGDASEVGVLSMSPTGFVAVTNPAEYFLAERRVAPGSALTVVLEGNRPLVLEIQALCQPTSFGYPKRAASGFDANRLQLLLAILERHTGVATSDYDVYVNVVGGWRIKEPAADLAVAAAVVSSIASQSLPDKLCLFGEVGLTGEIRRVMHYDRRAETATRLGYEVLPFKADLRAILQDAGLTGGQTSHQPRRKSNQPSSIIE
jgi:DNA repair protein RadA/Sms